MYVIILRKLLYAGPTYKVIVVEPVCTDKMFLEEKLAHVLNEFQKDYEVVQVLWKG